MYSSMKFSKFDFRPDSEFDFLVIFCISPKFDFSPKISEFPQISFPPRIWIWFWRPKCLNFPKFHFRPESEFDFDDQKRQIYIGSEEYQNGQIYIERVEYILGPIYRAFFVWRKMSCLMYNNKKGEVSPRSGNSILHRCGGLGKKFKKILFSKKTIFFSKNNYVPHGHEKLFHDHVAHNYFSKKKI